MFDIKSTLFTGKCFINLPQVDSTNLYTQNLLKKTNMAEGTVVSTFNQTKGKGNANNVWLSEAGKNISFSILYCPTFLSATQQFYLNMAICLGIIEALSAEAIFSIKWPNDIYYEHCKIGGLLIENILLGKHLKHSVIGIGINVNQTLFEEALPNPSSLKNITKKEYNLFEMINNLLIHIEKRYLQLKAVQFKELKQAYLGSLYLHEQAAQFKVKGKLVNGIIKGVNENGQLLIKIGAEVQQFGFKEVAFVV